LTPASICTGPSIRAVLSIFADLSILFFNLCLRNS
jgi:hypothetical protein